jgi:TPR repeat protein
LTFAAPMAAGPLEDGYAAYQRGDFATAMQIMRPLADQGHVTAQNVVGLLYYFNYGGDYVSAYMWFNLAAAQGNSFAEMFLKDTVDKMTPEQIAEAQKLARKWRPTTQPPR